MCSLQGASAAVLGSRQDDMTAKKAPDKNAYVEEMMALDLEAIIRLDQEMTEQEMVFLNVYLRLLDSHHESPVQLAVDRAKYQFKSEQVKLIVGNRILAKWQGKQDHKEIMRLAGLGPLQITMKMISLLKNSKSDTSKVQVLNIATKCQDMQKNSIDVGAGVDLIIKRTKGEGLEEPNFELDMTSKAGKKKKNQPIPARLSSWRRCPNPKGRICQATKKGKPFSVYGDTGRKR